VVFQLNRLTLYALTKSPKTIPVTVKREGIYTPLPLLHYSSYTPTCPEYSRYIPTLGTFPIQRLYKLLTPTKSFLRGIEDAPRSNLLLAALLSTFDRVSCILKDSASLALRSAEVTPTEV
jgi:hypothetical protein